jgi:hypothetical protein
MLLALQFSLATITGTASWLWGKTTEYAAPAATYAKSGAWFAFCAAALLAVPVLIEMQREAMLVVEKEHQTQQVEELQRQIASARSQASITSTIGALVGGAAGGDAAGAGAEAPAPSA